MRRQINARLPDETRRRLNTMTEAWGYTQAQTLVTAVNLLWQEFERDTRINRTEGQEGEEHVQGS